MDKASASIEHPGVTSRRAVAHCSTVTPSTPSFEDSKKSPSAVSSWACGFISLANWAATLPKVFPVEVRVRALSLLRELGSASAVVKQIMLEYPGTKMSVPTVTRMAAKAGITLGIGRPVGIIEDKPRKGVDPEIAQMAEAALGEEGSLRKAAAVLGISHAQVKRLTSDDN